MPPTIIFFGSFGHYSALVLAALVAAPQLKVIHVITTPPFINRKGQEEKSPVQELAERHHLSVTTTMPEQFSQIAPNFAADFLVTAGYGRLLPPSLLAEPKIAALNLHFSVLPKYRGANPGEWAILMGETESGISIIEMNEEFDQGGVLFTTSTPLSPTENRESLYQKLYLLGAEHLPGVITQVEANQLQPIPQPATNLPYASRFKREDGFIDWEALVGLQAGQPVGLKLISTKLRQIALLQNFEQLTADYAERAARALFNFPSLWTLIPTPKGQKRMKIHSARVEKNRLFLEEVQIEGKNSARWNQVKNQVI